MDLPHTTLVVSSETARVVDSPRSVMVLYGERIELLYRAADQDGWLEGLVICCYKGEIVAVPGRCLRP